MSTAADAFPKPSNKVSAVRNAVKEAEALILQNQQAPVPPSNPNAQVNAPNTPSTLESGQPVPQSSPASVPGGDAGQSGAPSAAPLAASPADGTAPTAPPVAEPLDPSAAPLSPTTEALADSDGGGSQPIVAPKNDLDRLTKAQLIQVVAQERQRHNTLRGKYSAELPVAHDKIRELQARNAQLEQALQDARQAPAGTLASGAATPPDPRADAIRSSASFQSKVTSLGLDDSEADELLQATLAAIPQGQTRTPPDASVAPQDFGAPIAPQASAPNPQAPSPTASAEIPLESELRTHVEMYLPTGSYDVVANSNEFNDWLAGVDPRFPGSGTRGDAMRGYYRQRDYVRAAMFFNDWAKEFGYTAPPTVPDPRDQLVEPAPSAAGSAETLAAPEVGDIVTAQEIAVHQQQWASPRYRASEAGKQMKERIDAAIASGNVR